ncbi:hypothetical protein KFE25_009998 [Diacronema lutheri]|uniref:Ribosomal protein S18 n=1 Tax=Diacronema lutheri TaxID=2081491 RepID=A0A8J6CCC3_DIALT|nr:hypothetical protein KFE25_009998 [Diacronema lutheri]
MSGLVPLARRALGVRAWARAFSSRGPAGSQPQGNAPASSASAPLAADEAPVTLVRWARFGKALKPEDVGSVLTYGKLSARSSEPALAEPSSPLPTVRARIKLSDPLHSVPIEEIVYTNVALLSRFVTETGAMLPRRRTGVSARKQRKLANAIKVARQMNLMPYLSKLPQHYDAKP